MKIKDYFLKIITSPFLFYLISMSTLIILVIYFYLLITLGDFKLLDQKIIFGRKDSQYIKTLVLDYKNNHKDSFNDQTDIVLKDNEYPLFILNGKRVKSKHIFKFNENFKEFIDKTGNKEMDRKYLEMLNNDFKFKHYTLVNSIAKLLLLFLICQIIALNLSIKNKIYTDLHMLYFISESISVLISMFVLSLIFRLIS